MRIPIVVRIVDETLLGGDDRRRLFPIGFHVGSYLPASWCSSMKCRVTDESFSTAFLTWKGLLQPCGPSHRDVDDAKSTA
jgi:hypothetical protein